MYIEGGSFKNPPMGINMILLFIPLFSDQKTERKSRFSTYVVITARVDILNTKFDCLYSAAFK